MSKEIEACVKNVISEALGVEESKVTTAAILVDDLGADSLDCVEIIMALEQEFNCEISDEEAEKVLLVQDAIELIKRKTA